MHVRLNQLLEVAFKRRQYDETVQGEEHDVIVVFEEVLSAMSRKMAQQAEEIADLRKQLDKLRKEKPHGDEAP